MEEEQVKVVNVIFNKDTVNEKKALCDLSLILNDGDFAIISSNRPGKSTVKCDSRKYRGGGGGIYNRDITYMKGIRMNL